MVKVGYQRRGEEQRQVAYHAYADVEIERRGEVVVRQFRLPYECVREAAVDEALRHHQEHQRHGDDAIVVGREQAGKYNAEDELHTLRGETLNGTPNKSFLCL